MAIIRHVVEYSNANVIDGVIKRVKIVGTRSRNGYTYNMDAIAGAVSLYENAPVYILHPDDREKKFGTRKLDSHFGNLTAIRIGDGGLFGDLHVRQSHPMAGLILECDGKNFGLSHNAVVEMNADETEVTRIVSVNSVDLVDNPATTTNLFEEEEMADPTLAEAVEAMSAQLKEYNKHHTERLTALESLVAERAKEVAKEGAKPDRLTMLEEATVLEGEEKPAPIGNTYDDFLGALHGFQITNTEGAKA